MRMSGGESEGETDGREKRAERALGDEGTFLGW